ncbi:1248_t:CDS:1, partial [Cetraspora pellucida]
GNKHLELNKELLFSDWQSVKNWLYQFVLQESFDYKVKISKKDELDKKTI